MGANNIFLAASEQNAGRNRLNCQGSLASPVFPEIASPEQLPEYLRTYWGIKNGVHYRRDGTFKKDRCRLRLGRAARTMATLNNLVLPLVLRQGYTNVPDVRRRYASRPLEAPGLIFQQP